MKNFGISGSEAKLRAEELLLQMGLPVEYLDKYPHELSGGECQRAALARAMAMRPQILVCDEVTSALDVSVQAQIVDLLLKLYEEGEISMIFISHDLALVQGICDKIIVMYAGKIVEEGTSRQIFYQRCHPYTEGLLASVPKLDSDVNEKLKPIKGNPPDMSCVKPGCAFAPRCSCAMQICVKEEPPQYELDDTHVVSCWQTIKKALQDA